MNKMDEMDRNIQLRSEEWGYKTVLLALCAWTLYNLFQAFVNGTRLEMMPCLILCLSVCVQWFSQNMMKRTMIAGDEEYQEPNKVVRSAVLAIIIVTVIMSIGAFLYLRG